MKQTPPHDNYNPDLLSVIPSTCRRIIEVGCSSGALARAYKRINPDCNYLGIDIESEYINLASQYCDEAKNLDIEDAPDAFFNQQADRDCWIFGDTLEHLRDPWLLLHKIKRILPPKGCIVACIPNTQHWSIQVRLAIGDLRYEESGLLDRTHLRWFTRQTLISMFEDAGFQLQAGFPRIFAEADRDKFLPLIGNLAARVGVDPKQAMEDATPLQYVIRAGQRD